MEAIILGNPYNIDLGSTSPIVVPAYTAEEAVIILSDGYNPYVIGGTTPISGDQFWFRYGTGILRPLTITDKIIVGGSSVLNNEIFRVVGKGNFDSIQLGSSVTISSILDEDDMISNSDTSVPTQQSVKAYVDNKVSTTGIQPGDNITLLTNNAGYITTETDPIFVVSPSYGITSTQISHWDTAYGWGNHALVGYLTTETDPIFTASPSFAITSLEISNWNSAVSASHTHNNFGLLETIIASGSGNNALTDDGTYKPIISSIAGSDTQIQFNNSGNLGASSNLTFITSTNTLNTVDILSSGVTYIGNSSTSLSKNIGGDLVFTDANSGSVSLATILGAATNYWTTTTGGIYYTNYVGINNPATLDEALTVNGNIQASYFNSSYLRYKNSNLLLGPNVGDSETGSNKLYIDNIDREDPIIYGELDNRLLTLNADVYIQSAKILNFGTATTRVYWSTGNNLTFQDAVANSGNAIKLTELIDGTYNALKADFTDYTAVKTITAGNKSTWNAKEPALGNPSVDGYVLSSTIAGVRSWVLGAGSGVIPTDNIFKWDGTPNFYYRPYTDKTEAGGVSSGGKFYGGTTDPTNSNRLNYDGALVAFQITGRSAGVGYGVRGDNTSSGDGVQATANSGVGIRASSVSGVTAIFNNGTSNTSDIAQFQKNSVNQCEINTSGINLITGATYKINGNNILNTPYNYAGTGIKSGFTISVNGVDNTKIDIASGTGYIVDNSTPGAPILTPTSYAGTTALTLTYIASANATYLAINSSGTVIQQTTEFTPIQRRSLLIIGAAIHSNRTIVNVVNNLPDVAIDGIAQFNDFLDAIKNFNVSGNIVSPNGVNLSIDKSSGSIFKKGANFINNNLNPHILSLSSLTAPSSIRYRLQNGTEYSNTNVIDPDNYDNAGVLTTVPPNKYTVQRISIFSSNLIRIQYGQTVYNSMALALQGMYTDPFVIEQNISDNGLLRSLLVVKSGTTDLTNSSDARFFEVDRFGTVRSTVSGVGVTTMQQSYDNSNQPQITTSTLAGAVQYKRGSAADTDKVFEILNGSGTSTFSILGTGAITIPGSTSGLASIVAPAIAGTPTLTLPTTTGTLALTSQISAAPIDGLLHWDGTAYNPYSTQQASLSFDTSGTTPTLTTRLNLNAELHTTALNTGATGIYLASGNAITIQSVSGYAINAFNTGNSAVAILSQSGTTANSSSLLTLSRTISGAGNVSGNILSITDNPTTSGTISGKVLTATIGTTERISFNPRVEDSGTNIAYILDTHNTLSGTTTLLSVQNNSVEKFKVTPYNIAIPSGASTTFSTIGGCLKDFYTDASTSGTGETDLYSYTIPSYVLATNGNKIEATYAFTIPAYSSTINIYFGGTSIGSVTSNTAGTYDVKVLIIRSGGTAARCFVNFKFNSSVIYTELSTLNFATTNILKITGQVGTSSITARFASINYIPASVN